MSVARIPDAVDLTGTTRVVVRTRGSDHVHSRPGEFRIMQSASALLRLVRDFVSPSTRTQQYFKTLIIDGTWTHLTNVHLCRCVQP
jgi:hypothetical protein